MPTATPSPTPAQRLPVPEHPRGFSLVGLALPASRAGTVAQQVQGATVRSVVLTTEGRSGSIVRFSLSNMLDPAVLAGTLLAELRRKAVEVESELLTFPVLGRLAGGTLIRVDYFGPDGEPGHALIAAFPHPGVAGASVAVVAGSRADLRADAALATELDQMLRGLRFLPRPEIGGTRSLRVGDFPLEVRVSDAWDGPVEHRSDQLLRRVAPDGSLATIRVRGYDEAGRVASSEVLQRYLDQLGSDPAYVQIRVQSLAEDTEPIAGLSRASRAETSYRRGDLEYASVIVALAYGDGRSFVVDVQAQLDLLSSGELRDEIEAVLASMRRA